MYTYSIWTEEDMRTLRTASRPSYIRPRYIPIYTDIHVQYLDTRRYEDVANSLEAFVFKASIYTDIYRYTRTVSGHTKI